MNLDKIVMAFAGTVILLSLLLSVIHSSYWLLLTAFAGANIFQAAFTGFCPIVKILKNFGIKPGTAFE